MAQPQTHLARLLEQWQAGNQDAAAELVRHYAPVLRTVIKSRLDPYPCLRGVYDVEDVLQDTWKSIVCLIAGMSPEDLNNDAKLTAFLQELARRKATRTVRTYVQTAKRDVRCQVSLEVVASRIVRRRDPNLDPARRLEQIDLLTQSLARLPPEEQTILRLKAAGSTLEQLAEEFHCSQTIMSRRVCELLHRMSNVITAACG